MKTRRSKKAPRPFFNLPRKKGERRRTELFGVFAVALFVTVITGAFFASSLQRYALRLPNIAAVVTAVLVELTNADRAQENLSGLTVNPVLVAAAQAKANDMATKGYFAHVGPDGTEPWHWFNQVGYSFEYAGENLAVNFTDSADVNKAWMNSPTHRENILNPKYTEIGIATAEGMYKGRPAIFVVQAFGTPSRQADVQPVITQDIPENPTVAATAVAQKKPSSTVAGSQQPVKPVVEGSSTTAEVTTPPSEIAPLDAADPPPAQVIASESTPLWGLLVAYPKNSLRYLYYALAVVILIALAYITRFEMHAHHIKHAGAAMGLIFLMGALLIVADFIVFTPPVLAAVAASL